jgi:mono/diheme cytochrome c family protein
MMATLPTDGIADTVVKRAPDDEVRAVVSRSRMPETLCFSKGQEVTPGPLPQAYMRICADCHGADGKGKSGQFPSLESKSFSVIQAAVRNGRPKMPAFPHHIISESDLLQVAANMTNSTLEPLSDEQCSSIDSKEAELTAKYPEIFAEGIQAWRKPDAHGVACANCHSPDAFDLAWVGYDEGTIIRRALMHVDENNSLKIARLIQAQRQRYGMPQRDPTEFRPFQPGGKPLSCASAEDCDHRFGLQLAEASPTLAGAPISDVQAAKKARAELLGLNPRTFPIGIALNRWTEDESRGEGHNSINDWIPDFTAMPTDEISRQNLYAAHDTYIANPSWANLNAVIKTVHTFPIQKEAFSSSPIMKDKLDSVLVAQHLFRQELTSAPFSKLGPVIQPEINPIWETGDVARVMNGSCKLDSECLASFPSSLLKSNVIKDNALQNELSGLRMSWFWAGWLNDLTLYRTNGSNATNSSEYFTGHLYSFGYFNHLTYLRFIKNLTVSYIQGGDTGNPVSQTVTNPEAQNYGYFLAYGRGIKTLPPQGEKRELYKTLLSNSMRMMLFLIHNEVAVTGRVYDEAVLERTASSFEKFLSTELSSDDPVQRSKDTQLLAAVRELKGKACQFKPLGYKQAPYPGHCSF